MVASSNHDSLGFYSLLHEVVDEDINISKPYSISVDNRGDNMFQHLNYYKNIFCMTPGEWG
jgi:hypothetical protein